jgi:hypothetical protein
MQKSNFGTKDTTVKESEFLKLMKSWGLNTKIIYVINIEYNWKYLTLLMICELAVSYEVNFIDFLFFFLFVFFLVLLFIQKWCDAMQQILKYLYFKTIGRLS